MAEEILMTRLSLKYDSYANWELVKNSFVPKKGEVCFVEVPASASSSSITPTILFKVGDGSKVFAQLPYGSGKAADVNVYALQNADTFKSTIESWISGAVQDTDTYKEFRLVSNSGDGKYKLQERTVDNIAGTTTEWVDVAGSVVDVSDAFDRLTTLEDLIGDESVADQISTALEALDLANTYADKAYEAKVTALESKMDTAESDIDTLEAKVGNTSVSDQIDAAIGNLDGEISGEGFVSSISEIDGKVSATLRSIDAADVPTLSLSKISDAGDMAEKDIVAESDLSTSLIEKINSKQDLLVFENDDYDPVSNKAVTKNDIKGIEGGMHFKGVKESLPTDLDEYEPGDFIIVGTTEYVLVSESGSKSWLELGDEGKYAIKGNIVNADIAANAAINRSKVAGLIGDLNSKVNKVNGKSLIANLEISKLAGMSDGANCVRTSTNGYISIDGVKTKVYEAPANTVVDTNYRHITVTSDSVSDGNYTFNKYDDTALSNRISTIESKESDWDSKQDAITETNKLSYSLIDGLGTIATKDTIAKSDLSSSLKSEVEGKIDDADLAVISKTGNENDLIQLTGDALVVSGGSISPIAMPVKGNLIMMNLGNGAKSYRVLKIDDTTAEVFAMYDANTNHVTFNDFDNHTRTYDPVPAGSYYQLYENSTLDKYLNETWYGALSPEAKEAIQPTLIYQDLWDSRASSGSTGYITQVGNTLTWCEWLKYCTQTTYPITRYVYAISINDVVEYLEVEREIHYEDIWSQFFDTSSEPTYGIETSVRTGRLSHSGKEVFYLDSETGSFMGYQVMHTTWLNVRPTFRIDLSKISWALIS